MCLKVSNYRHKFCYLFYSKQHRIYNNFIIYIFKVIIVGTDNNLLRLKLKTKLHNSKLLKENGEFMKGIDTEKKVCILYSNENL